VPLNSTVSALMRVLDQLPTHFDVTLVCLSVTVGWGSQMRRLPDRTATLVSMLAAESAVAIDREHLMSRLEHLARRDELTGAFDRRVLGEKPDRELARARRSGAALSVVMLDLDHFKSYHDTFGHQAGDRLLKSAAEAWSATVRTVDTVARYGGEEFVVILPNCTLASAIDTADELREVVPEGVGCSAGVAVLEGVESAAQLIGRADRALYVAKATGRNRTSSASLATHTGLVNLKVAPRVTMVQNPKSFERCSADTGNGSERRRTV